MTEKRLNYPGTNTLYAIVYLDDNGKLAGPINTYDRSGNNYLTTFINEEGRVSQTTMSIGSSKIVVTGPESSSNMYVEHNNAKEYELLNFKYTNPPFNNLSVVNGATSTILGAGNFSLTGTLSVSGSSVKVLSELSLTSSTNYKFTSKYKDAGVGDQIIETTLKNPNGIELVRRMYKNFNVLSPVYSILKNINSDEIHGTFKGTQIPTLGNIENL